MPGAISLAASVLPIGAQPAADVLDFTDLSLEELEAVSISAASKRAQPLFETPAAVSVLLPVDVRRTGHASVAEALRLIPGTQVSYQLPNRWGVGVRGSNGLTSTKLLVLVDGRSVYSPFYGSVEWPNANVHPDDLARVEVVRGPGATLWGANAVNGIINVISKDARDTLGALVAVRTGTGEPGEVHVRYGGRAGERTWYRVYGTVMDSAASLHRSGNDRMSDVHQARAGVRTDSELTDQLSLTLQAEYLENERVLEVGKGVHQIGSLLARLRGQEIAGGDLTVQMYVDQSRARAPRPTGTEQPTAQFPMGLNEDAVNFDVDVTHHLQVGDRHAITWGGGARRTLNEVTPSIGLSVSEAKSQQWLFNAFVQDEVSFYDDRFRVTVGSKLEHHETIGWQPQPNLRLTWLPQPQHALWAAVSHAVRAPSRVEREVLVQMAPTMVPGVPLPVRPEVVGNPDFAEERNTAYELGWRWRPSARVQTDLTAYAFDYDSIRDLQASTHIEFGPIPTVVQRYSPTNDGDVATYGAELAWQWRVHDGWELSGAVAYQSFDEGELSSLPFLAPDYAIPAWTGHLRSWWQLPGDWEFSTAAYATSRNPLAGLPAQVRLDAQFAWQVRADLALTFGVLNASDPHHPDSNTGALVPSIEQRRSVYVRVQWRY
ncbi:MAG TPA: TonB-dependent receptor [Candidatus Synoicihabitans sp.]|nr:TonB-dependent receptor [Candidatus Synoicihabitans sp.]